jgi:hypothetical protein
MPWDILAKWDIVFGIVLGVGSVVSGILWVIRNAKTNRVARVIAWAVVGESDKTMLKPFADSAIKSLVSALIWAIIWSICFVLVALFRIVTSLAPGSAVLGVTESLKQCAIRGAVLGTVFGVTIAVVRVLVHRRRIFIRPRESLFQGPQFISAAVKDQPKISASFVRWQQCTIVAWVLVPLKGQGLRGGPTYRYLLSHRTHQLEKGKDSNVFALRYYPPEDNQWGIWISNEQAEHNHLTISDRLEPGWHHFLIAWDHSVPRLVFLIDGGSQGSNCTSSYRTCWPARHTNDAFVGSWVAPPPPFANSYCETRLSHLLLFDSYLTPEDPVIRDHLERKPGEAT